MRWTWMPSWWVEMPVNFWTRTWRGNGSLRWPAAFWWLLINVSFSLFLNCSRGTVVRKDWSRLSLPRFDVSWHERAARKIDTHNGEKGERERERELAPHKVYQLLVILNSLAGRGRLYHVLTERDRGLTIASPLGWSHQYTRLSLSIFSRWHKVISLSTTSTRPLIQNQSFKEPEEEWTF